MSPEASKGLLAYTPMFHSRMFSDTAKYRDHHFEPLRTPLQPTLDLQQAAIIPSADTHLDGNPDNDRPLFVQFCSNSPEDLLKAAQYVQPFCDAVDLNLGCPQGIARKGKYGAFLQEDWGLIHRLINTLHTELGVPVTAKMRILETKERTLEYAKMLLSAGASIITVHGRQREQKGHNTGLADWTVLRYLREQLPSETVIFANGNILQYEDIETCLAATGADGVMSAEGNLYDPSIFAKPPPEGQEGREYWRGRDGKGGYRMDAVLRRYMDIMYRDVLGISPPIRQPLFLPSDPATVVNAATDLLPNEIEEENGERPKKKQKRNNTKREAKTTSPNLTVMQAHCFKMLRPLVAKHTNIRDALARCRAGDLAAFENVLQMVENAVKAGLIEYESGVDSGEPNMLETSDAVAGGDQTPVLTSGAAVSRCKRPWFICQPYVRPLPQEAVEKGAMTLSKRERARLETDEALTRNAGQTPEGRVEEASINGDPSQKVEIAKEGLVCG